MMPPIRGSFPGVLRRSSIGALISLVTLAIVLAGCSKHENESPTSSDAHPGGDPAATSLADQRAFAPGLPSPSHTESAWIVKSVADEIVRTGMFAARLEPATFTPDPVSVTAKDKDSGGYHYAVDVHLPKREVIHITIDIPGSIWDPKAYVPFTRDILSRLSLDPSKESAAIDGKPLVTLTNLRAEVIQDENRRISKWLTAHPLDLAAHQQAALVIGAMGLREHFGAFYDYSVYCNRATAHLALARTLLGSQPLSDTGAVAEMLIGLQSDLEQDCEGRIDALTARIDSAPEIKPWTVTCRMLIHGDYRLLPHPENGTLLERMKCFETMVVAMGPEVACKAFERSLNEPLADWPRIVLGMPFSVGMGHGFTPNALPLEFAEQAKIFPELASSQPSAENLARILNREPGHLINRDPDGSMKVAVIDDSVWAMFFQRRLFSQIHSTYSFLDEKWGVEERAAEFKKFVSGSFQRLTLFPLLSVADMNADWMGAEAPAIRKLVETHPEWVPEYLWAKFLKNQHGANTNGFPLPEGWCSPGLPPGTVYRFGPRQLFLANVNNASLADVQRYHAMAPWHYLVTLKFYRLRSAGRPDPALFKELFGGFFDYCPGALDEYSKLLKDNPPEYIAVMHRGAAQNPNYYLALGKYLADHHMEKEAVEAYENAMSHQADPVSIANDSEWIVNYYADHGNIDRAMEIAKFGAEVYSYAGLETMARFMERLNRLTEAEDYFQKIDERYHERKPLTAFYVRQSQKNPGSPQAEKLRKVGASDFQGAPRSGVIIQGSNALLEGAGMKSLDIIVALDGQPVKTMEEYEFVRGLTASDDMDLIVYSDGKYRAVHAKVPGRRFQLNFMTYHP